MGFLVLVEENECPVGGRDIFAINTHNVALNRIFQVNGQVLENFEIIEIIDHNKQSTAKSLT